VAGTTFEIPGQKSSFSFAKHSRQTGFFRAMGLKKPGFSPARQSRAGEKPGFWQVGHKLSLGKISLGTPPI